MKNKIIILLLLSAILLGCSSSTRTATEGPDNGPDSDSGATPKIFEDFGSESATWGIKEQDEVPGSVTFGVADNDAEDGKALKISLNGNPSKGPSDWAGPHYSQEVHTKKDLGYGTYRFRFKPAACTDTTEEVITGIFNYANDGSDKNGNGMEDNNEIDIEVLCASPHLMWLTIWTDYTDSDNFRRLSRKINFRTGKYYDTEKSRAGEWGTSSTAGGTINEIIDPDFDATRQYLEMGFEWRGGFVRFFIKVENKDIDLWKMDDPDFIPPPPAPFLMNVWHSDSHWVNSTPADFPKNTATLSADWFKYWE